MSLIFVSIPEQKRVTEVLKKLYFPYSAFQSAGQWGPPATLLVTAGTFLARGAVLTYKEMHPCSKSKNKISQPAHRKHCYITS